MLRTFIHLPPFERRWRQFSLGDDELRLLQLFILLFPEEGDVIKGTHGIRKMRWKGDRTGKRGGLRIFYLDLPESGRTFLITAVKKSDDANLSRSEQNNLAEMVLQLKRTLRKNGEG